MSNSSTTGTEKTNTGHSGRSTTVFGRVELLDEHGQSVENWLVDTQRCSIGTNSRATIRIAKGQLSDHHATIVFGRRHTLIKSAEGELRVGAKKVREWLIDEPATIGLGNLRFVVYPTAYVRAQSSGFEVPAGTLRDATSRLANESNAAPTLEPSQESRVDAEALKAAILYETTSVITRTVSPIHESIAQLASQVAELIAREVETPVAAPLPVDPFELQSKLPAINAAIEVLDERISQVNSRTDQAFESLSSQIREQFSQIDARISSLPAPTQPAIEEMLVALHTQILAVQTQLAERPPQLIDGAGSSATELEPEVADYQTSRSWQTNEVKSDVEQNYDPQDNYPQQNGHVQHDSYAATESEVAEYDEDLYQSQQDDAATSDWVTDQSYVGQYSNETDYADEPSEQESEYEQTDASDSYQPQYFAEPYAAAEELSGRYVPVEAEDSFDDADYLRSDANASSEAPRGLADTVDYIGFAAADLQSEVDSTVEDIESNSQEGAPYDAYTHNYRSDVNDADLQIDYQANRFDDQGESDLNLNSNIDVGLQAAAPLRSWDTGYDDEHHYSASEANDVAAEVEEDSAAGYVNTGSLSEVFSAKYDAAKPNLAIDVEADPDTDEYRGTPADELNQVSEEGRDFESLQPTYEDDRPGERAALPSWFTADEEDKLEGFDDHQASRAEPLTSTYEATSAHWSNDATDDVEDESAFENGDELVGMYSDDAISSIDESVSYESETYVEDEEDEPASLTAGKSGADSDHFPKTGESVVDEEDGESVEDYMQRLLQRVKGEASGASFAAPPKTTSPATVPIQKAAHTEPVKRVVPEVNEEESLAVEDYIPRSSAPENNLNLAAMRALANETARSALAKSSAKTLSPRSNSGKLGISAFGFVVGTIILLVNGIALNVAFLGMTAAYLIFLIWGFEATQGAGLIGSSTSKSKS